MKKADYAARGARAYEIGIIRFAIATPRGWQQSAEREGYTKARDAWRAANPGVDELDAARARALESATRVIGGTSMRKADYAALAAIIQKQYAGANHCAAQTERTPENREYFRGAADAVDLLARNFAACASVNRAEFLKACGIAE